jgi:hypothetical protein
MDREVGVQILIGDIPRGGSIPSGVLYRMERLPTTLLMTQEITILKEYGQRAVWGLWIKVYEFPPFDVSFRRWAQDT